MDFSGVCFLQIRAYRQKNDEQSSCWDGMMDGYIDGHLLTFSDMPYSVMILAEKNKH